jgi:AcrR family transcriptional regulator
MRMDKLTRLRHPALDRGPDPRVVRSRQAALSAVRELLAEEGWTGVTHVAVAARSGVGRTTLYRHWPDVASLIHDAIVERIGQARTAWTAWTAWTGDLRADLISELNGLRRLLHDPASERTMRGLLERAPFDPAFASLKETLYRSGSAGFRAILEAATTRGELQPDTDIPLVIDQLAGPLMYRRLFAGLDIEEKYAEAICDSVLRLHANPINSTPRRGHRRKES